MVEATPDNPTGLLDSTTSSLAETLRSLHFWKLCCSRVCQCYTRYAPPTLEGGLDG